MRALFLRNKNMPPYERKTKIIGGYYHAIQD